MANEKKPATPDQTQTNPSQQPPAIPADPKVGPDGQPLKEKTAGDEPTAFPNAASTGQGTTQEAADKAAAGNYRVLEPISYAGPGGMHTQAKPGDIVYLNADDAVGLMKAKAVESADTSGASKPTDGADPRKIQ